MLLEPNVFKNLLHDESYFSIQCGKDEFFNKYCEKRVEYRKVLIGFIFYTVHYGTLQMCQWLNVNQDNIWEENICVFLYNSEVEKAILKQVSKCKNQG